MSRMFFTVIRFANKLPHRLIMKEGMVPGGTAEIVVTQYQPDGILLAITEDIEEGDSYWVAGFEGERAQTLLSRLLDLWEQIWPGDKRTIEPRIAAYSWCDQDVTHGVEDEARGDILFVPQQDFVVVSLRPNGWEDFGPKSVGMESRVFKELEESVEAAVHSPNG